jgi:hypothetical protein
MPKKSFDSRATRTVIYSIITLFFALSTTNGAVADDAGRLCAKIYGGLSFLSDNSLDQIGVAAINFRSMGVRERGGMAGS